MIKSIIISILTVSTLLLLVYGKLKSREVEQHRQYAEVLMAEAERMSALARQAQVEAEKARNEAEQRTRLAKEALEACLKEK